MNTFRAKRPLKGLGIGAGAFAALLLLLFLASFFIDEPLRRFMQDGMNEALEGYTVRLAEVDFNPIDLSVTVNGLILIQEENPEPPVAEFPVIIASLHWRELLSGHLVADWRLERPALHINLQQLRSEEEDETPVEKRGWQEALKHIYPLKINHLEIKDGSLIYISEDPERPLKLTAVNLSASNIRNIDSPDRSYPSPFRMEADIFDSGHGVVKGSADFLAEPHPGVQATMTLSKVPLENLKPVSTRANLFVSGGTLDGDGEIEFSPTVKRAILNRLSVDHLKMDYVHTARTAEAEERRAEEAKEKLEETKESEWLYLIHHLQLNGTEFGYVNKAETPNYRVSLSDTGLRIKNLSNRFHAGEAEISLEGSFMYSGDTFARGIFRPTEEGANFDLLVAIEGTRVEQMNNLLRAHTGVDVVAGTFSLYSEVEVRGKSIDGYVKPLFEDLDVYDARQEEGQGLISQIKEGVVGALSALLKNPEEKVATQFDLAGSVENPDASTWQIVAQLIRNAFFDAILPGFENRNSENN